MMQTISSACKILLLLFSSSYLLFGDTENSSNVCRCEFYYVTLWVFSTYSNDLDGNLQSSKKEFTFYAEAVIATVDTT